MIKSFEKRAHFQVQLLSPVVINHEAVKPEGRRPPSRGVKYLYAFCDSLRLWVGLLDDNEEEVLVWGDEDLLSASAHSEECHVVDGVDVTHY